MRNAVSGVAPGLQHRSSFGMMAIANSPGKR
jgi:hypothetical protein